jgi:thymidylate synthase
MQVIKARNVNTLFLSGLELLGEIGEPSDSRAGRVIVAPTPVMSIYNQPCERVLFDAKRDANPFFHLMEGLWMLAGRQDTAFLNNYVKDFGSRFGEIIQPRMADDVYNSRGVIHGAYGHRWRHTFGFDQLDEIVGRLRKDPTDRQCVLQMWDASQYEEYHGVQGEYVYGSDDLNGSWKDRPCNTHCYFRVQETTRALVQDYAVTPSGPVLDMTILCRSNDIVWGAYGANAVHMSMLLEYVAGRVGVGVGMMYQLSNNYHGYVRELDRIGDPRDLDGSDPYDDGIVHSVTMAEENWEAWDRDLLLFMQWHDHLWTLDKDSMDIDTPDGFRNLWFHVVAGKVAQVNWLWKQKRSQEALSLTYQIEAPDWQLACREWISRRLVS